MFSTDCSVLSNLPQPTPRCPGGLNLRSDSHLGVPSWPWGAESVGPGLPRPRDTPSDPPEAGQSQEPGLDGNSLNPLCLRSLFYSLGRQMPSASISPRAEFRERSREKVILSAPTWPWEVSLRASCFGLLAQLSGCDAVLGGFVPWPCPRSVSWHGLSVRGSGFPLLMVRSSVPVKRKQERWE